MKRFIQSIVEEVLEQKLKQITERLDALEAAYARDIKAIAKEVAELDERIGARRAPATGRGRHSWSALVAMAEAGERVAADSGRGA